MAITDWGLLPFAGKPNGAGPHAPGTRGLRAQGDLTGRQPWAALRWLRSVAVGKSGTREYPDGRGGDTTVNGAVAVAPTDLNDLTHPAHPSHLPEGESPKLISKSAYEKELARLQTELVRMQEWIVHHGLRVMVIFEGRDTAGKGGTIKRIMERLNARYCRGRGARHTDRSRAQPVVLPALHRPPPRRGGDRPVRSELVQPGRGREGHGVLHRGGARGVLPDLSQIERALVRSGIILIKYWLSLSDVEQERRFTERINNPGKRWKLSPMDLEARARWVDYAEAKDEMFAYTDIKEAPWHVVDADDKKAARLNIISHLLDIVPYEEVPHEAVELPDRQQRSYERPPIDSQTWVPARYVTR